MNAADGIMITSIPSAVFLFINDEVYTWEKTGKKTSSYQILAYILLE